jgi:hypothetical protein
LRVWTLTMCSGLRGAEERWTFKTEMGTWECHAAEWYSTKHEQADKKDFVKRHMFTTPMHY